MFADKILTLFVSSDICNKIMSIAKRNTQQLQQPEEAAEREVWETKIFVSNLHPKLNSGDLVQYFSLYGPVGHAHIVEDSKALPGDRHGFVLFENLAAKTRALDITVHHIKGQPVGVHYAYVKKRSQARRTVLVKEVGPSLTFHEVLMYFRGFGEVENMVTPRDPATNKPGSCAYIVFVEEGDAARVYANEIHTLQGISVKCEKPSPKMEHGLPVDSPSSISPTDEPDPSTAS